MQTQVSDRLIGVLDRLDSLVLIENDECATAEDLIEEVRQTDDPNRLTTLLNYIIENANDIINTKTEATMYPGDNTENLYTIYALYNGDTNNPDTEHVFRKGIDKLNVQFRPILIADAVDEGMGEDGRRYVRMTIKGESCPLLAEMLGDSGSVSFEGITFSGFWAVGPDDAEDIYPYRVTQPDGVVCPPNYPWIS